MNREANKVYLESSLDKFSNCQLFVTRLSVLFYALFVDYSLKFGAGASKQVPNECCRITAIIVISFVFSCCIMMLEYVD